MKGAAALLAAVLVIVLSPVLVVAAIAGATTPAAVTTDCTNSTVATSGTWQVPLHGRYVLTSGFGMRFHPIRHIMELHTGDDLAAMDDKTIYAAADGTVTTREFNAAYGNEVVLDNGGGITTRYAHMAHPATVTVGQQIHAGHKLGVEGATGYVTGPHLHFEIDKRGKPINPKTFMSAHGAALTGGSPTTSTPSKMSPATAAPGAAAANTAGPAASSGSLTATLVGGRRITLNSTQLSNAATIAAIGNDVGAGERGNVIALMAALQESGLRNLTYGDRDSLGLFQQRAGWGTAQQRQSATYAARAFFGGPSGPNHGHPPGLLDTPGWKTMGLGSAAQAVQVSAFPTAYDKWEPVAEAIINAKNLTPTADCTSSGSPLGRIRVLTWNVCLEFCGHGRLRPWRQRVPAIAATIKAQHPDVVTLQETGHQDTQSAAMIRALAPQYKLAVYKRSTMVLYNPDTLATTSAGGTRLEKARFVVQGKGGVAQILRDTRTGKTVVVSSLHPNDGTNDARRLRYVTHAQHVAEDLQKTQPGSIIIQAGDFNSYIPGSGTKKDVARYFTHLGYQTAEQVAKTRTGQQYRSYNAARPPSHGPRIDHVIIDPLQVIVNSWHQVLSGDPNRPQSDHNMIVVDLTPAASTPAPAVATGATS